MIWLSEVDRQIRRRLAQIRLPFIGVIKRTGKAPQVAGLNGELFPDTPHIQHVGIASGLPLDAEVVMLPLMGKTARVVIVGSRGGLTVDVAEGEMCIYDQFGHKVHLGAGGIDMVGHVAMQDGNVSTTGHLSVGTGASGSFVSLTGQVVTVANGVVINITGAQ